MSDLPYSEKSRFVHIGSQITARARDFMMRRIYEIHGRSMGRIRILYMDTDSLFLHYPNNLSYIIDESVKMGTDVCEFKDEYPNKIQKFQAITSKMYRIKSYDGIFKYKLKGMNQ